jgi:hypothetical protein
VSRLLDDNTVQSNNANRFRWIDIILVLCSPAIENLPGPSGLSVATILDMQLGKKGFFAVWWCICATAFFVVTTASESGFLYALRVLVQPSLTQ